MAVKLAYSTSMKMKNIKSKVRNQIEIEKLKIKKQFIKRKKILERYFNRAPIVRLMDKLSFILGVLILISTAFIVGRYPNTLYYNYHVVTIISLVLIRFFNYKMKGWHYYLIDFCYLGNTIIIYFLKIDPKNDILFKMFFVYANGPFALSIPTFKNSLVFHKIDNFTSLAIHMIPLITSWNLKWITMEHELTLREEDRYFLTLKDENEAFNFDFFIRIFVYPLAIYLLWAFMYYLKVFVISSKKIKERNYETLYIYFMN